jgi:phage tail-like protein
MPTNHLINYLPAIYQDDRFAQQFLEAFEPTMLAQPGSLETQIATLSQFFSAQETPREFLPWLASWVALSLRDDWEEAAQRRFVERIVSLYQKRGTKAGLEDLLKTYTDVEGINVLESTQSSFEVGNPNSSTIGVNTFVGGAPAFYFQVTMRLDTFDLAVLDRKAKIARAIIDQEKPAHTYYDLEVSTTNSMQVGIHSTIGVDTLLPL